MPGPLSGVTTGAGLVFGRCRGSSISPIRWAIFLSACWLEPALAQQGDLVDLSRLGERGVIFETRDELRAMKRARGLSDFDGDGLDDIALVADDLDVPGRYHSLTVVYGGAVKTGRHTVGFAGALPRSLFLTPLGPWLHEAGPLGDLDGDGLGEIFVPDYDLRRNPDGGRGAAFIIYGVRNLEGDHSLAEVGSTIRGSIIESSDPAESVGWSVLNVGDFNGDGEPDLAIAGPASSPEGRLQAGVVFLLYRSRNLPPGIDLAEFGKTVPGTRILGRVRPNDANGRLQGDTLGWDMSAVGDFNGDGLGDLALMTESNIAFLVLGRPSPPEVIDLDLLPPNEGGEGVVVLRGSRTTPYSFGRMDSVAGIGDLNGDGLADLALGLAWSGIPGLPGRPELDGIIQVIYGRPNLPGFIDFDSLPAGIGPQIRMTGSASKGFGRTVSAAGDLNLDGIPDVLTSSDVSPYGAVQGIFGRRDLGEGVTMVDDLEGLLVAGEARPPIGGIVGPAGDFNGDGAPDVLAVAWGGRFLGVPGAAYVIYGTGAGNSPFTLLGIEPDLGPLHGGTTVTLRGSGILGNPLVRFGDRAGERVEVVSAGELRVVTPPGLSLGRVDVSVTVEGSTLSLTGAFEYTPEMPSIDLGALGGKGLVIEGMAQWRIRDAATIGDLTGDGTDDLAIGLLGEPGERVPWRVLLLTGGPGLPERIGVGEPGPGRSLITSQEPRWFDGFNVAVLGDMNGDGVGDLGIAPGYATGYLLLGRRSLPETLEIEAEMVAGRAVKLELRSIDPTYQHGLALAPLGDLTGDGLPDFAVGLGEEPPDSNEGRIFFVQGSRDLPQAIDLQTSPLVFAHLHGSGVQGLGNRLAPVGDVNGDGYHDLLTSGWNGLSQAYLLYLGPGMPQDSDLDSYVALGDGVFFQFLPPRNGGGLPLHVAAAGDVNRDGRPDLLLGRENGGDSFRGVTYLLFGSKDLLPQVTIEEEPAQTDGLVRIFGEKAYSQSGRKSGPVGDLNGDGYGDLVVGQDGGLPPGTPGAFALVLGGPALPEKIDLGRLAGGGVRIAARHPFTGTAVPAANAGDLNGDGTPDLVLAEAEGGTFPGAVYVVFGAPPAFLRGDANRDGALDLSDPILLLSHLFLGDASPICEDAADSDDTGDLSLTDAVYVFLHLYLGGPPPGPPFPQAGKDPTPDALGCRLF